MRRRFGGVQQNPVDTSVPTPRLSLTFPPSSVADAIPFLEHLLFMCLPKKPFENSACGFSPDTFPAALSSRMSQCRALGAHGLRPCQPVMMDNVVPCRLQIPVLAALLPSLCPEGKGIGLDPIRREKPHSNLPGEV